MKRTPNPRLVRSAYWVIVLCIVITTSCNRYKEITNPALVQQAASIDEGLNWIDSEVLYRTKNKALNSKTAWVKVRDSTQTYLLVVSNYKKLKRKRYPEKFVGLRYFKLTTGECRVLKKQLVDLLEQMSKQPLGINEQILIPITKGVTLIMAAKNVTVNPSNYLDSPLYFPELWVGNRGHIIDLEELIRVLKRF